MRLTRSVHLQKSFWAIRPGFYLRQASIIIVGSCTPASNETGFYSRPGFYSSKYGKRQACVAVLEHLGILHNIVIVKCNIANANIFSTFSILIWCLFNRSRSMCRTLMNFFKEGSTLLKGYLWLDVDPFFRFGSQACSKSISGNIKLWSYHAFTKQHFTKLWNWLIFSSF